MKNKKTIVINITGIVLASIFVFFISACCLSNLTNAIYYNHISDGVSEVTPTSYNDGYVRDKLVEDGTFYEFTDTLAELIFFTNQCKCFKAKVSEFENCKASDMGEYIPAKLGMDEGEHVISCKMIYDLNPTHKMVYVFENGKGLRVSLGAYVAKSRRRKISGAYSTESPLAGAVYGDKPVNIFIRNDSGRGMLIKSDLIPEKSTRTASGVQIMKLPKKGVKVDLVTDRIEDVGQDALKCKKLVIPSSGSPLGQLTFNF